MHSNIRTADLIKAIKYFVMRNEVTFTGSGPPVLSSARAPAGRQNRSTNFLVAFLYSFVRNDDCCDCLSLSPLIFPVISVDWYFFMFMCHIYYYYVCEKFNDKSLPYLFSPCAPFLPKSDLFVIGMVQLLAQCCHLR